MDTTRKVNLSVERGKLKQKFAGLMNDDRLFFEGIQDEMFGRHQTRIDQTEDEIDKIMSSLDESDRIWALYYGSYREYPE